MGKIRSILPSAGPVELLSCMKVVPVHNRRVTSDARAVEVGIIRPDKDDPAASTENWRLESDVSMLMILPLSIPCN